MHAVRSMKFEKSKHDSYDFTTDEEGKVCVHELVNVDYITANYEGISESWNIKNNHIDVWT